MRWRQFQQIRRQASKQASIILVPQAQCNANARNIYCRVPHEHRQFTAFTLKQHHAYHSKVSRTFRDISFTFRGIKKRVLSAEWLMRVITRKRELRCSLQGIATVTIL